MPGYEAAEPRLRCVLPFEATAAEVPLLRRAAVAQLDQWGMACAVDEAELIVAELATNVIKHVGERTSAALILECRSARLRVEVHDRSHAVPVRKAASGDDECGRGLQLLDALAADWGTVLTTTGKAVWCEITPDAGGACRRVERAAQALETYQRAGGRTLLADAERSAGLEEAAIKLIADILHWSTARGHAPDDILDQAQMHYEAEAVAA
ncbi:ATP-binding protein [Streptomyces sp. NPDC052051]|uniref:ATP-binding protein n=1 Tax=Streptomyces sp. NPDC052051 TaxID=3154649 RepID=UPI0034212527